MSDSGKTWIIAGLSLLVGAAGAHFYSQQAASTAVSSGAMSSDKVATVVEEVLTNNPQIITNAFQAAQKQAYEERMAKASEGLRTHKKALESDAESPSFGAEDAPITVVEFFDYHCGYCKRMTPVVQKIVENHKDVRIVFKELPILSADSRAAAKASLAFSKLAKDKYFDFHTALINHRGKYSQDKLNGYAEKLGVKAADLEKEMKADWVEAELKQVAELAESLGIQGTPAIIVGEEMVPGAMDYDALETRVKALKEKS